MLEKRTTKYRIHRKQLERKIEKYTISRAMEQAMLGKLSLQTSNEEPLRIQYIGLYPIYVFPKMKLCGLVISNTEL